jgi:Zn-dependent membrane protease YugP
MGLLAIIGIGLLLAIIFGPQFWVKHVIQKHSKKRDDFPGTGGELAQHLLGELNIDKVKVEVTKLGDHYDPRDHMVRLLPDNHDGRSVSAVAIAAHEVGHAIQHHEGNKLLNLRQKLVSVASITDKFAAVFFFLAPVLGLVVKSPAAFVGVIIIGISFISIRLLVHLVTLPVEWDASFAKALPILEQGGFLHPDDMPAARQVLKAAALTYVSVALASLLDLARWIRILR